VQTLPNSHLDVLLEGRRFGASKAVHYSIKDPLEAVDLARSIAADFGDSRRIQLGLNEIILNAIEHGNLEIGFRMKTILLFSGAYMDVIDFRLKNIKFRARHVDIFVEALDNKVRFTVADQGQGFDPKPYLRQPDLNAQSPNGRGIALAGRNCFDALTYNQKGNVVVGVSKLEH